MTQHAKLYFDAEDGTVTRFIFDNGRRYDTPEVETITPDMPQCSSRQKVCNLHEHPDIIECCVHQTFRCNRCQQIHPWEFGAADDAPGLCDDCWSVFFGSDPHDVTEPMGATL